MRFALFLVLVLGCGSRTGLFAEPMPDASSAPDADVDADVGPPPIPTACTRVVYTQTATGTRFATDRDFLYYAEGSGDVVRVSKLGGTKSPIAHDAIGIVNLEVDETFVYWSTPATSQLVRAPKTGGAVTQVSCGIDVPQNPKLDASNVWPCFKAQPGSRAIGIDATSFYVGATSDSPWPGTSGLFRVPKSGTYATGLDANGGVRGAPEHILADAEGVYWSTANAVVAYLDKTTSFSILGPKVGALAIDDVYVYWTRYLGLDFDLARMPKKKTQDTGDTPEQVLPRIRGNAVAVDEAFLYFVAPGIAKTPKSGGATTILEPDVLPNTLALDGPCIYWLSPSAGGFELARTAR